MVRKAARDLYEHSGLKEPGVLFARSPREGLAIARAICWLNSLGRGGSGGPQTPIGLDLLRERLGDDTANFISVQMSDREFHFACKVSGLRVFPRDAKVMILGGCPSYRHQFEDSRERGEWPAWPMLGLLRNCWAAIVSEELFISIDGPEELEWDEELIKYTRMKFADGMEVSLPVSAAETNGRDDR